jgi:hypothetical protein
VGTNTTWEGSSSWATTSGGAGANTNFPLAQDTAVIDNSTTLSGTLSVATVFNMSALNCSTRTNSLTLSYSAFLLDFYGSFALGSGITISGGINAFFVGRNTMDFTSAGKSIPLTITVSSVGGSFRLLDALSATNNFTLNQGTVNLNSFALTALTLQSAFPIGSRTIGFGTGGSIVLTASGTVWNMSNSTALTTTGTGTISCSSASAKTFTGADLTYTGVTLNNAGAGALTITGSNTFEGLSNSVQPTTFTFTAGTTTTVNTWNINGTSGNLVTIGSATAASHTLSKSSGTVSSDFLSISRSTATGGAAWFAGANSTDGGNNVGWIFTAPTTPTAGGNFMMMLMG